ncbi:hypothetical protein [Thalassospira sp.]|uniref:hypothetical protein n=1 Tax=Thalassospira sp. TaxID=1912094 RepID=UPI003AA835AC
MSFPISHDDIARRCKTLARQIADDLARRQRADGQFPHPDFYAKAFAVNLWHRMDRHLFAQNIERAQAALKSEPQNETYHREFIEYALRDTPNLRPESIDQTLRDARQQCPDVANWQILGLINRQKRDAGILAKFVNLGHFAFILLRYWRAPAFLDRANCFSAQYHAFCTALLTDSNNTRHQRIAHQATAMIARLADGHGFANLLGRGAGQSFGAACALYALLKNGYPGQASCILHRMEDARHQAGELPLNLLAAFALPVEPGPENQQTPGWYSYNRHDDYLAFAGYWLCKASELQPPKHRQPVTFADIGPLLGFAFSTAQFHAQMTLSGAQTFDISGAPVIVCIQGKTPQILLPPTGGEEDAPSLYGPASRPLPAISETEFCRFIRAHRVSDNRIDVTFKLAGAIGHRQITFENTRITIVDHVPGNNAAKPDLLRILVDGNIELCQITENTLTCPKQGVTFTSDAILQITPNAAFSAAGPATRISAKPQDGNRATLTISWDDANA